jgi:hypothetical protein
MYAPTDFTGVVGLAMAWSSAVCNSSAQPPKAQICANGGRGLKTSAKYVLNAPFFKPPSANASSGMTRRMSIATQLRPEPTNLLHA